MSKKYHYKTLYWCTYWLFNKNFPVQHCQCINNINLFKLICWISQYFISKYINYFSTVILIIFTQLNDSPVVMLTYKIYRFCFSNRCILALFLQNKIIPTCYFFHSSIINLIFITSFVYSFKNLNSWCQFMKNIT